jgi:phage terminase Nu1 subunit (DNA packaging protein)
LSQGLSTRREAVAALGLPSARALDRLIERGAPLPTPGKRGTARYDVPAIKAWRDAREARRRPTLDLTTERAKLARVQTQLTTLKLQEARGELVKATIAIDVQRSVAGAVRSQLLAVPRRAVLEGLPRVHEPIVRRLIVAALRELSEVRTMAALEEAS